MWIRTQDKKQLIDVVKFSVSKSFGGKGKSVICGQVLGMEETIGSVITLGEYASEDKAIMELDSIQTAVAADPHGVYQMN